MSKDEKLGLTIQKTLNSHDFYQLSREEILDIYQVNPEEGLSQGEAAKRLEQFGPNKLAEAETESFWQKLLNQFNDFMIIILIIAAIISGAMGEVADSIIILAIVLVNAILGVLQEGKAEEAIKALQNISAPEARILRNGEQRMISTEELVLGDIVVLEAGDIVPADLRVLEASNLKVEEASLTGESVPVEKHADFMAKEEIDLGDRENMLFSSTAITYGRGKAVVVATGQNTEVGNIASSLQAIEEEDTPLQISLNHLGKTLGLLTLIVCAIVFVVGWMQGGEPLSMFMTSVSLAVAAIPEGLPAVVTIVLSLGMNRMAERNAIVKRLLAVETLGSIDTICSDKTGTLTQNEMTVEAVYVANSNYQVSGSGYAPTGEVNLSKGQGDPAALQMLMEIATLCNDAELYEEKGLWNILGDPTEGALVTMAAKAGVLREKLIEKYTYEGELPFDSKRKAMSVFFSGTEKGNLSLTKGAPDILLQNCKYEYVNGETRLLTEERRAEILNENKRLAEQALRVLSFAFKVHENTSFENAEKEMCFVGLAGMIDPPREEAKAAIAVCHKAGIRVVMITGDYAATALAIAKNLNIADENSKVLTGSEIENMSDEELEAVVEEIPVYARVSPEHKVRIIRALKNKGHSTSMTGDGVNDAPALKMADIGVAMGITGTEVAKSSSQMILTDDNFATIVSAVQEGRIIYSNIRKFVNFLLSCNVGEILVVFITNMLLGPTYSPLLPIQLLWLNLVTDSFPALALGQEKGEDDIMELPPRDPDEKIIDKPMMGSIIVQAIAIFICVFIAFQVGRYLYPDVLMNDGELVYDAAGEVVTFDTFDFYAHEDASPSRGARTFAFVTLILAELIRAFSCRSEHQSVFSMGLFSNPSMNRAVLASFVLMLVVLFVPFTADLFHTITPTFRDMGIMFGLSLIPFVVGELYKLAKYKK